MWEFIKMGIFLAVAITVGYFFINLVFVAIMLVGIGIGEVWSFLCKKLKGE